VIPNFLFFTKIIFLHILTVS